MNTYEVTVLRINTTDQHSVLVKATGEGRAKEIIQLMLNDEWEIIRVTSVNVS